MRLMRRRRQRRRLVVVWLVCLVCYKFTRLGGWNSIGARWSCSNI
jgi:hypothetical protein